MIILRYKNVLADGPVNVVSCCLLCDVEYAIGRSSKNKFAIKNDKSISRQHVSLLWKYSSDDKNVIIQIKNFGKVTMIKDKYLSQDETLQFTLIDKKLEVNIGTSPITLEIFNQEVVCNSIEDIQNSDSKLILNNLNILQDDPLTLKREGPTIIIKENSYTDILLELFSNVFGIPIVTIEELRGIANANDFYSYWDKIYSRKKNKGKACMLDLSTCYYISEVDKYVDYVKVAIRSLNAEIKILKDKDDLVKDIRKNISKGNISKFFVLSNDITQGEEAPFNISVTSIAKLLEAVKTNNMKDIVMHDYSSFKIEIPREVKSPKDDNIIEKQEPPAPKRRRMNRSKVKPLDTLSFFAGGMSHDTHSINTKPSNDVQSHQETEKDVNNSKIESIQDVESNQDQTKYDKSTELQKSKAVSKNADDKLQDSTAEKPINFNPTTKTPSFSPSINDKAIENSNANLDPTMEKTRVNKKPASLDTKNNLLDNKLIAEQINEALSAKTNDAPVVRRRRTLLDYGNTDKSSSTDLVRTIQNVKSRGVDRVNSKIVTVDENELNEEELNKFFDVVVVDVNDKLMKKHPNAQKVIDNANIDHNSNFKNRKDYKLFKKSIPKWQSKLNKQHHSMTSDNGENLVVSKNRNKIPLRKYNENEKIHEADIFEFESSKKTENPESLPKNNNEMEEKEREINAHTLTFSENSSNNKLFYQEEDEDEEQYGVDVPISSNANHHSVQMNNNDILQENNTSFSDIRQNSDLTKHNFNSIPDDSDDDSDDEPKFKFNR
ncbi:hypothetical protein TPHA_0J02590 [Tetrapisispora phaffii CBS 4417]|uniref:FHA domain-containing protein n=1 Tax=Tetrapisispora phaffii (strain ATCC 24235 / CBS 4417 / NBRC 1672 / NRRL Y-8282 / UCD 70-5) TaxID=1071381 RepID=G8BYY7_TETPH|nr:hypothetical protein TPHA_0J02590 [Tetrapisispora phaffii CBS 4417]CCE65079.1 hypothetical protein TPHA_0J02590 [Tetrapisispora phaffii CBS 4417]